MANNLIADIKEQINSEEYKFVLYVVNDDVLVSFLSILDAYRNIVPEFASVILIIVDEDGSISLTYNDVAIRMCSPCSKSELLDFLDDYITKDFEDAWESGIWLGGLSNNTRSALYVIAIIISSVVVLGVVGFLIYYFCLRDGHDKVSYSTF